MICVQHGDEKGKEEEKDVPLKKMIYIISCSYIHTHKLNFVSFGLWCCCSSHNPSSNLVKHKLQSKHMYFIVFLFLLSVQILLNGIDKVEVGLPCVPGSMVEH